MAATATPDTTMPSPMPMKCRPSSGRWPWRISQLSTSPEASSKPAVLEKPATKRSPPHHHRLSVSPIAVVLSTATTSPTRYSTNFRPRSPIEAASSAPDM